MEQVCVCVCVKSTPLISASPFNRSVYVGSDGVLILFPRQLELKKTLLDRMVHLLSRGYVLPVVGYIRKCLEKLNTDISLIRYFVTEVTAASDLEMTSGLHE